MHFWWKTLGIQTLYINLANSILSQKYIFYLNCLELQKNIDILYAMCAQNEDSGNGAAGKQSDENREKYLKLTIWNYC